MADKKIVDLTLKSPLVGTEEVVLNDSLTDKKTTVQDIANLAGVSSPTPHDETSSRLANTPYQNTTGKTMYVSVVVDMNTTSLNDSTDNFLVVDPLNTFLNNFYQEAYLQQNGAQSLRSIHSLMVVVPSNYYYKLINSNNVTGSTSIVVWVETY